MDKQRIGGQNRLLVEKALDKNGVPYSKKIEVILAKDCEDCSFTVQLDEKKSLTFSGKGLRGSNYASTLANVLSELSKNNTGLAKETLPGIAEAITKVLLKP